MNIVSGILLPLWRIGAHRLGTDASRINVFVLDDRLSTSEGGTMDSKLGVEFQGFRVQVSSFSGAHELL